MSKASSSRVSRRVLLASSMTVLAAGELRAQPAPEPQSQTPDVNSKVPDSNESSPRDQGILDLAKSPHAKLRNIPIRAVSIESGFWAERRKVLIDRSIPTELEQLVSHGRMENFRRLSGKSTAPQSGPVYGDAHVYKWLDAVGCALQGVDDPALRKSADSIITDVVAAQESSGYINTYYVDDRAAQRMLPATQTTGHEIYSIGHLVQAGIAYYRATGDRRLLDTGIRFFRDYVNQGWGPAPKKPLVSGHPGTELSMVELYRITGDKQYLDLAAYLLRGDPERINLPEARYVYMFCGTPFTSRTKLEGHAVRAMYATSGATDYYLETGDQTYWRTLETLWADLVNGKMYITGAVGSRAMNEAFGDPYELPNARAYAESCASVGNVMWNWRMLAATGESRFTDVIERVFYNGLNSAISLDGTLYCYRNPLDYNLSLQYNPAGDKIRNPWYTTNCCPSNVQRALASLPGYLYGTSKDGVYVHLFQTSKLDWHLENGTALKISQTTNYPWEGAVNLTVSPAQASEFTVYVRIPGWSATNKVSVNGRSVKNAESGKYLALRRRWSPGDTIDLQFDMTPKVIRANPRVVDNGGRVALQRGPLVYCLEGVDHPGVEALDDVALVLGKNPSQEMRIDFEQSLLGGVTVLRHPGVVQQKPSSTEPLYQPIGSESDPNSRPLSLKFIPYYAFANRGKTPMQVWVNCRQQSS